MKINPNPNPNPNPELHAHMASSLAVHPSSFLTTLPLHRPCYPLIRRAGSRGVNHVRAYQLKPISISLFISSQTNPHPHLLLPPPHANSQDRISQSEPDPSNEVQDETVGISPNIDLFQWDAITSKLSGSATLAFLMLQLPQIILNSQNLINGNKVALFAVQWMGQLTSLLGNLCLLSYFAKKRETGAMIVQAVGVISTWVVLLQLAMAGAMPSASFTATTTVVGLGLVLNLLNYKNLLSSQIWGIWEDVITIGSVSVLPQVMWSTFSAVLPPSILPGTMALVISSSMIALQRLQKLPSSASEFLKAVSAWTATLLFMWGAVAQMWTNYLNPENIRGLSVFTVLLAMIGNGLLLPRALFTRDSMWFTGASWGTILQGWGILITMYMNKCITDIVFWGTSAILALWLGTILTKDSKAYSLSSPFSPLIQIYFGGSDAVTKKSA